MKLHGHPWSVNTRKVLMVLAEKGHRAELVHVDLPTGAHRTAAHLTLHPFGKVPVLADGDFVVYETAAVMRYLDEALPGPSLWPSDARSRARALQWDRVQQSYFEPHAHPLLVHAIFVRHLGAPRDEGVIRAGREGMLPALDVIDRWLAAAPYLAGDRLSLADLSWMPYLEYLAAAGEGAVIDERPGVAAWWERLAARPAWAEVARTGPQPYDPHVTAADARWR